MLVVSETANEIKREGRIVSGKRKKCSVVILIILALNEQKISSISWEKNERQDKLAHLKDVLQSACLSTEQMILFCLALCSYRLVGGVDVKAGSLNAQEIFQDQNLHSKDIATRFLQDGIHSRNRGSQIAHSLAVQQSEY